MELDEPEDDSFTYKRGPLANEEEASESIRAETKEVVEDDSPSLGS